MHVAPRSRVSNASQLLAAALMQFIPPASTKEFSCTTAPPWRRGGWVVARPWMPCAEWCIIFSGANAKLWNIISDILAFRVLDFFLSLHWPFIYCALPSAEQSSSRHSKKSVHLYSSPFNVRYRIWSTGWEEYLRFIAAMQSSLIIECWNRTIDKWLSSSDSQLEALTSVDFLMCYVRSISQLLEVFQCIML
jgi:hypothetical protein